MKFGLNHPKKFLYLFQAKITINPMQSTPQNSFQNSVLLYERTSTVLGSEKFRYSFQGQEHDDEIKGEGNSVNYKYRMHDPRIGRFFAVDPLMSKYPHNSPYAFSENKLIHAFELEGLECFYTSDGIYIGQIGKSTAVRLINEDNVEEGVKYVKWAMYDQNQGTSREKQLSWNTNKALEFSSDVGMTNEELNTRATLSVIMSGEGGEGPDRYKKKYGGGVLSDIDEHPGLYTWKTTTDKKTGKVTNHKSSMAGAYQFKGTTFAEISKKIGLTDFSEESQDKAAVNLLKTKGVLDEASSGDIQQVVDKLKASTWTSLQKVANPANELKKFIANELSGNSLIKTEQGKLDVTP